MEQDNNREREKTNPIATQIIAITQVSKTNTWTSTAISELYEPPRLERNPERWPKKERKSLTTVFLLELWEKRTAILNCVGEIRPDVDVNTPDIKVGNEEVLVNGDADIDRPEGKQPRQGDILEETVQPDVDLL